MQIDTLLHTALPLARRPLLGGGAARRHGWSWCTPWARAPARGPTTGRQVVAPRTWVGVVWTLYRGSSRAACWW